METFTWVPDFGGQKENAPTVTNVKFGDGYETRYAFGLNTNPQTWNISFENRSQTDSDAISAFLNARAGVEAFQWTPPGESGPLLFVCRKWTKTFVRGGFYSFSMAFEQVFEPT